MDQTPGNGDREQGPNSPLELDSVWRWEDNDLEVYVIVRIWNRYVMVQSSQGDAPFSITRQHFVKDIGEGRWTRLPGNRVTNQVILVL